MLIDNLIKNGAPIENNDNEKHGNLENTKESDHEESTYYRNYWPRRFISVRVFIKQRL